MNHDVTWTLCVLLCLILTLRAAISEGKPWIIRTISLSNAGKQMHVRSAAPPEHDSSRRRAAYLPRPSAAGSLCASFVPPGVVLSNPPLRIHREADVDAAFEFWVGAVKHVHTVEAFHLHYHY